MFGIGFPELLLILAIALMVIGPRRLPDIAKALGRAMGEFRRATDEFKQTLNEETRTADIRKQILDGGKLTPPGSQDPYRQQDPAGAGSQAPAGVNPPPPTDQDAGGDATEAPAESDPSTAKDPNNG